MAKKSDAAEGVRKIAAELHVSERTVRRWLAHGHEHAHPGNRERFVELMKGTPR